MLFTWWQTVVRKEERELGTCIPVHVVRGRYKYREGGITYSPPVAMDCTVVIQGANTCTRLFMVLLYVHQHSNIDMKEFSSRINNLWFAQ